MKLISLKCPTCGAKLEVSDNAREVKCEYCGITSVIDDEVVKVEHHFKDDSLETKFENAEAYLTKLKDYDRAFSLYQELSVEKPLDPRIWYGLLISKTENFSVFDIKNNKKNAELEHNEIEKYFLNYIKIETDETKKIKISKIYDVYNKEVKRKIWSKYNLPVIVIIAITILSFLMPILIYTFYNF